MKKNYTEDTIEETDEATTFEKERSYTHQKAIGLWKRSIISFVFLGIFITIIYGTFVVANQNTEDAATAINISGRQRMLSQRIALFANEYASEYATENIENQENKTKNYHTKPLLKEARDLFEKSHHALLHGDNTLGLTDNAGKIAHDIYYAEPYLLDRQVQEYLSLVDKILTRDDMTLWGDALAQINKMSEQDLLTALDKVVKKLEVSDKENIHDLLFFEKISFLFTLLLLISSVLFVVRPYHKFVMNALQDRRILEKLTKTNDALNESVAKAQEQAKLTELAKEEAEKANQTKSDFLANMSHELRTPLNSIIGVSQMINEKELTPDTKEMFQMMTTSSKALLYIVNDILDLSKIEAGEMQLDYLSFDAIQQIEETVQTLKPLADKKGLILFLNAEIEKLYTLGDEARFSRILSNLLENAIRYTDKGSVQVTVTYKQTFVNQIKLYCEVKDTGVGIPKRKIDKVFEKFTQADTSSTRKFDGAGLGLTITKELVELMDGEIGVESEEGVGSKFWFEIPFEVVDEMRFIEHENNEDDFVSDEPVINSTAKAPHEVQILMAEDHSMNQAIMKKLFQTLNIKNYKIVENGQEALKEVENNDYDLVLMDCHMPVMNGYDSTLAIRALSDPDKKDIPIIAITADVMKSAKEKCYGVGMNNFISKPVDIEVFKTTLSPWIDFNNNFFLEDQDSDAHDHEGDDKPVNLDNLLDNAMGDDEFVRDMIGMFADQGQKQIDTLKTLCTDGENQNWVEISHALKGTAGGVGAEKMRLLCADAQNMEIANANDRQDILEKIESEYKNAIAFFIQEDYYAA